MVSENMVLFLVRVAVLLVRGTPWRRIVIKFGSWQSNFCSDQQLRTMVSYWRVMKKNVVTQVAVNLPKESLGRSSV